MNNFIEFVYSIDGINTINNAIELNFSIINHTNYSIWFSRRNTPFDNYLNDCFCIKLNNHVNLIFDGLLVKRFEESEIDIIQLLPRSKLFKKIYLSDSYKFTYSGKYVVEYITDKFRYSIDNNNILSHCDFPSIQIQVINNPFVFELSNKFLSLPTLGDKNRKPDDCIPGQIKFKYSKPEEEEILTKLTKDIIDISQNQFNLSNIELYEKWFGVYEEINSVKVNNNFDLIFNEIKKQCTTYVMYHDIAYDNEGKPIDRYAHAYFDDNKVYLYPAFWKKAGDTGENTKIGILIHEFSHIKCNTFDDVDKRNDALLLAKTNPTKAIQQANNYEFYFEDLLNRKISSNFFQKFLGFIRLKYKTVKS